jgi:hypothetical protein
VKDLWDRFDAAADSQSGVSESAAALKEGANKSLI